jgi:hypothetical protein
VCPPSRGGTPKCSAYASLVHPQNHYISMGYKMSKMAKAYEPLPTYEEWTSQAASAALDMVNALIEIAHQQKVAVIQVDKPFGIRVEVAAPKK